MIKTYILSVSALFIASIGFAQFPYFEKVLGAPGHATWGDNVTTTLDGNYLVAGYDQQPGNTRIHAMKFDGFGNVIFDYYFTDPGAAGNMSSEGYSALDDAAGNTYVVGHQDYSFASPYYAGDIVLIKMDPVGNVIYSKRYNNGVNSSANGYCAMIDANFITICGAVDDGGNADVVVLRVDITTGNAAWMQRYEMGGFEYGWNIEEAGGNIYVTGTTGNTQHSGGSPFLMELNPGTGAVNWCRTYVSASNDWFTGLATKAGGGFVLSGTTGSELGLIAVDPTGNYVWSNYYSDMYSWQPNWGVDVIEDSQGDLVIATETTDAPLGPTDAWMLKTDPNGNIRWSRKYDPWGGGTWQDGFHSVVETPCGYMATGWYNTVIGGSSWDYAMVHVDTAGYTGCEITNFPTVTPGAHVMNTIVPVVTGNITVQNGNFTATSVGFTNQSPCLLSFDVVADAAGPFCDTDAPVNLTAVYPNGSTYGTVDWSGPGITNAVLGTFDPSVAGVGNHEIIVHWPHICEERFDTIFIDVTEVTVNSVLTNPTCPTVCDGSIDITATSPFPVDFYSVDLGTTNQLTGLFNGLCANTYDIVVIDSLGCSDTTQAVLTDPPQINVSFAVIDETCPGDCDGSIDITASGGTGVLQYSIDNGATFQAGNIFNGLCTGNYDIVVQDANSCDSITVATVAVAPPPAVTITPIPGLCANDPNYNLAAAPIGGLWNGVGIIDPVLGVFDPSIPGGGTHWVYYTGTCSVVDSAQIVIDPGLSLQAFTAQTICVGASAQISVTPTGGSGSYDYQWVDDQANFMGTNDVITVSPTQTTMYYISATDSCSMTTIVDSVEITVLQLPDPTFTISDSAGCSPFLVTFNSNAAAGSNCLWVFGDGYTSAGCGSVSHSYIGSDCFDVQLIVTENGCVDSMTYPTQICVYPQPQALFTFTPQVADIENTEIGFINNSIFANTYSWDFGDNSPFSNQQHPFHIYPETPGAYTVTLVASDNISGCTDTLEQRIIINDVIIFYIPNVFTPNGDHANETFKPSFTSGIDPYQFHMLIFNRWGEVVWESYDPSVGWDGHYGDGGLVQDGTYIWQIDFLETMSDKKHEQRGHVTVLK